MATRAAAVGALALLFATGCSGSPDDTSSGQEPTVDTSVADAAAAAATRQAIVADPQQALTDAVAGLGTSYKFATLLTTAADDQVSVAGYRIGDDLSYQLVVGGETVEVITATGSTWVLEANTDEWLPADAEEVGDPLGPLTTPASISADADGTLHASYDAAVLLSGATGTLEVTITLGAGAVTFTSTDGPLTLSTTLTAATSLPAIVAPL